MSVSEILYDTVYGSLSPYDQKISWIRSVSEKRSPQQIVIQGRNCLSRIYITKLHEWRLVLRLQDKGETKIALVNVRVGIMRT